MTKTHIEKWSMCKPQQSRQGCLYLPPTTKNGGGLSFKFPSPGLILDEPLCASHTRSQVKLSDSLMLHEARRGMISGKDTSVRNRRVGKMM